MRNLQALALLVSTLLASGCAMDATSEDSGGDDEPSESTDAVSVTGKLLVGSYTNSKVGYQEFEHLALGADGKYTATIEKGPFEIMCVRAPCTISQSGRWTASKKNGDIVLKLRPTGATKSTPYNVYVASDGGPIMIVDQASGASRGQLHRDRNVQNAHFTCSTTNGCEHLAKSKLGYCLNSIGIDQTSASTATITLYKSSPTARYAPVEVTSNDYKLRQTSFMGYQVNASWDQKASEIVFFSQPSGLAGTVTIDRDFDLDVTCETR